MIVLGSTNKDKLPILENSPYANGHKNIKIAQVQVDSGASNQPLSEDKTVKGELLSLTMTNM